MEKLCHSLRWTKISKLGIASDFTSSLHDFWVRGVHNFQPCLYTIIYPLKAIKYTISCSFHYWINGFNKVACDVIPTSPSIICLNSFKFVFTFVFQCLIWLYYVFQFLSCHFLLCFCSNVILSSQFLSSSLHDFKIYLSYINMHVKTYKWILIKFFQFSITMIKC